VIVAATALRRLVGHPLAPIAVLCTALLANAAVLLSFQRGMTFLIDEWLLLVERQAWDLDTFLTPFYEHLFLAPILVFKVLMSTIGIGPHWVYAVPLLALHLTCAILVYALARSRVGPWFALAPAVLILFLGSSYDNLLLPIQVSFLGSLAAGLGMLLVFDHTPSRRLDATASLLLLGALASSSLGLVIAVAALVEILLTPGWRRRIWVVLTPAAIYGLWYLAYGPRGLEQGGSLRTNLLYVPGHAADSAAAVFGALSGLGLEWGRVLAVFAVVVLARAFLRGDVLSARSIALVVAVVSFWVLGGLARAHQDTPEASRYIYLGAAFVILLVLEALRRVRLDRRWALLLTAFVAFAVVGNADVLRGARDTHLVYSRDLSAQFAALEILGPEAVEPSFVAAINLAPLVEAEEYFDMVSALGSPVDLERDVLASGVDGRRVADEVFAAAFAGSAQRDATLDRGASAPTVEHARFGVTTRAGPCTRFDAREVEASLSVRMHGRGMLIQATKGPTTLRLRRLGESFQLVRKIESSSPLALPLPSGGVTTPWRFQAATRGAVEICAAEVGERSRVP